METVCTPQQETAQGCGYWVGRSAEENDGLLKGSGQSDLWFHLADGPSPHAILQCSHKGGERKRCVATVAAEVKAKSKAAGLRSVSVSILERKHVKSLASTKAGLVEMKKRPDIIKV